MIHVVCIGVAPPRLFTPVMYMYLGIDIDCKLCFEGYADEEVSKASQQMDIVKDFLYFRSKPLAWMLFKSCVITDVLPTDFIHQSIFQRQE